MLIYFFNSIEKEMAGRFISVNNFIDSIKPLLNNTKFVNIYFDDWVESQFYKGEWNVKFIGFATINMNNECEIIRYYDIHKYLPEAEYIKFKENKDKNMKELPYVRSLFKLVIEVEETEYKNIKYHKSWLKSCDQKLLNKLKRNMSEDRIQIVSEAAEKCEIFVEDIDFDLSEEEY